jgi:hypothetical protein
VLELVTGIIVAIIALVVVLEPLLRTGTPGAPAPALADDEDFFDVEESGSAKILALLALREIEFDLATGKLSESDYASLKHKYSQSALSAIKEERASEAATPVSDGTSPDAEALIAQAKSQRSDACPTCRQVLEPGAVFCSHCGRSLVEANASPRCWGCGADRSLDAKFCGECGAQFSEEVSPV